jgi:S-phase kinase-associated protein 1
LDSKIKGEKKIFFAEKEKIFFLNHFFQAAMQDQSMLNLDEETKETKETKVESLDTLDMEGSIELVSQEGEKFTVSRRAAYMSELVKTSLEKDVDAKEAPIPNVSTKVLALVIKYMNYHIDNPAKEIEKPLKSANMKEVVSDWDAEFVDLDQERLFEVILAANYMDIKPLLDLACAKTASLIKGKTPEQIRKTFNITNDFTPEEEAAVVAENAWASEA